jgi:hypothetical protein
MLGIYEDFDDDLLFDVIDLLTLQNWFGIQLFYKFKYHWFSYYFWRFSMSMSHLELT